MLRIDKASLKKMQACLSDPFDAEVKRQNQPAPVFWVRNGATKTANQIFLLVFAF